MILELLDKEYSIYQLNKEGKIDNTIIGNDFISITKTKDEISIVAVTGLLKYFEKKKILGKY